MLFSCGCRRRDASGLGDVDVLGFRQEKEADDQAHDRDTDRIPQAGIDVSGRGCDGEHGRRQEAAEPAVADVIGQRYSTAEDGLPFWNTLSEVTSSNFGDPGFVVTAFDNVDFWRAAWVFSFVTWLLDGRRQIFPHL